MLGETYYEKTRLQLDKNNKTRKSWVESKLTRRQRKPGTSSVDLVDYNDQAPKEGDFTGPDNS